MARKKAATVRKTVRFDCRLAGAISTWAAGAGVDFSEAIRQLCSQGLAASTPQSFAMTAVSNQVLVNEIRRAKSEAVAEICNAIEFAVEDMGLSEEPDELP